MKLVDGRGRLLNHVETVFRPGEEEVARKLWETLGCKVSHMGKILTVFVDPNIKDYKDTVIYSSQVTKRQWAFDEQLAESLAPDTDLGQAWGTYREHLERVPQMSFHFGIRFAQLADWEAAVARVEKAGADDPDLRRAG